MTTNGHQKSAHVGLQAVEARALGRLDAELAVAQREAEAAQEYVRGIRGQIGRVVTDALKRAGMEEHAALPWRYEEGDDGSLSLVAELPEEASDA